MKYIILGLFISTLFFSCTKGPGEGGFSSIQGKVKTEQYYKNDNSFLGEYYAIDEDVYIIYGDDVTYSDQTSTDMNGYYEFNYLYPGSYTVYSVSDDTSVTSTSQEITVQQSIEITDKKDIVTAPDLVISQKLNIDDGTGSISGKIYKVEYNGTFTSILAEYYAPEEWVYVSYNDEDSYFDRIRTYYDGSYEFNSLIPGKYKVFAYSRDTTFTQDSGVLTIIDSVELGIGESYTFDDLRIIK
jgi:hypothetical protein